MIRHIIKVHGIRESRQKAKQTSCARKVALIPTDGHVLHTKRTFFQHQGDAVCRLTDNRSRLLSAVRCLLGNFSSFRCFLSSRISRILGSIGTHRRTGGFFRGSGCAARCLFSFLLSCIGRKNRCTRIFSRKCCEFLCGTCRRCRFSGTCRSFIRTGSGLQSGLSGSIRTAFSFDQCFSNIRGTF